MIERRVIRYTGRVQGVGFRYAARKIASAYQIAGSVKNLPDGRVEIIAEGEAGEIDRFLEDVYQAMSTVIRTRQANTQSVRGMPPGFSIEF